MDIVLLLMIIIVVIYPVDKFTDKQGKDMEDMLIDKFKLT